MTEPPLATDRARKVLTAFSQALSREMHVVADRPELLWQQLHNRLQWEGDPVEQRLAPHRTRRSFAGAPVWMRTRTQVRESAGLVRTFAGSTSSVAECAFSPDGRQIVAGCTDGSLRVWETATGTVLCTLEGHTTCRELGINALAFSPDGSFVVTAGEDSTLRVWDPTSGRRLATLEGHTLPVLDCAISPDGTYIVSASWDTTLRLWDANGRPLTTLQTPAPVKACAVSPDGEFIVSSSGLASSHPDSTVMLWDPRRGNWPRQVRDHRGVQVRAKHHGRWHYRRHIRQVSLSPDAKLLYLCMAGGTVVCDPATRHELLSIEGPMLFAVTPDGRRLIGGDGSNDVKVWDAATGDEVSSLQGHATHVTAVAVSPDGSLVASADGDGVLKLWDMAAIERLGAEFAGRPAITCCAFGPEGAIVVSGDRAGTVTVWGSEAGDERASLACHEGAVLDCAAGPEPTFIASGGSDGRMRIWRLEADELWNLDVHESLATHCALGADGRVLVTGTDAGSVALWDATGPSKLKGYKLSGTVDAIAVSRDGSVVVSAEAHYDPSLNLKSRGMTSPETTSLRVWEAATGTVLRTLEHTLVPFHYETHAGNRTVRRSERLSECSISPDGRFVVAARHDGIVKLWDLATGEEPKALGAHSSIEYNWRTAQGEMEGHYRAALACAISPDVRYVASCGEDRTVRVWEVATGREAAVFFLVGVPGSVAFHPSLPRLACGDDQGNLYLLDLVGVSYGPPV